MPMVRRDSYGDLLRLRDEMENYWPFEKEEPVWAPRLDVKEAEKNIVARLDIPGMKVEDINVSVNKDTITISGERKMEKKEKGEDFVRRERTFGSFCRSFYLGIPIKEEEVKASYKDGILEVFLPKVEVRKAKKIKVEGGKQ